MNTAPTVWSIAGNDPSCGAGIQADASVIRALGARPGAVAAALTAQNRRQVDATLAVDPDFIRRQIQSLLQEARPAAVKTGMLGGAAQVSAVAQSLKPLKTAIVCDPVIVSSSGFPLLDDQGLQRLIDELFPLVTLLTPNLPECARLTGKTTATPAQFPELAHRLLAMGPHAVLIKGGHANENDCCDYYADAFSSFRLHSPRLPGPAAHGTGCLFSSAAATFIALGYALPDAVTLAKTCINQGLRCAVHEADGTAFMTNRAWPDQPQDFPRITHSPELFQPETPFPDCGPARIGLYPLVDNASQAKHLMQLGASTLQLRLKDPTPEIVEREVRLAVTAARQTGCRLFINDHWEAAIRHQAYGVHLGREDLKTADLRALHTAGLRLGTSTHSFFELASALALCPSYVAMGTVFPSPSKPGLTSHLGVETLRRMIRLAGIPAVAIGGLHVENAAPVLRAGASGVAVISDLQNAPDVKKRLEEWQRLFQTHASEEPHPDAPEK
ncbi:MAG: bifunctional hydroxymethylpyrimidine kinase/phosphomethylpyrimidine kinase [Kiritimatiellae bacterium]|nr:bifunctional hydroxymethylpyrimidine kinase/phosphomethylpyrimidine kinase [Kiritimatiellia bacterium]